MKIKTSELSDAALDWAVTKAQELPHKIQRSALTERTQVYLVDEHDRAFVMYCPSTQWMQGGPLLEWENITLIAGATWGAVKHLGYIQPTHYGPTPLIAAMRCYVASKLGDEVDVPDELVEGEQA